MLSKRALAFCALVLSLVTCPRLSEAQLDLGFGDTVLRYFQALERKDYAGALALTNGAAQVSTDRMLNQLAKEANAHRAKVELKVRQLRVMECPSAEGASPDSVPVDVSFNIDVVGRRGWFSRVARKLSGTARFFVSRSQERIVAIEDGGLMK